MCHGHDSPLDYLCASLFDQDDLLVWANRGGGKTTLAAAATVLDALLRSPARLVVLGGGAAQSHAMSACVRGLLAAHPRLVCGRVTRRRVRLAGGSEIHMPAHSPRAVRGLHAQKIRCDEVDLFDAEVWRAVQFAVRSAGRVRGAVEAASTMHRPGGLMQRLVRGAGRSGFRVLRWCLWEVIERCGPERRCGACPLADDCRGVARRGEGFFRIDDAIAIRARCSRAAWETEMLCRSPRAAGAVFGEFDRARHVAPVPWRADWPAYRAVDFGYRSPLVCLWIQLGPEGQVNVLDEYVRAQLPLARHAAEILRRDRPGRPPVEVTYVDPAGRRKDPTSGAACTELLAAAGIGCAWRASRIAEGLELIRAALAPPRLTVHPRCSRLIEAFARYHYPPAGSAARPDTPVKDGPDHLIDALRYFFVNRLARP